MTARRATHAGSWYTDSGKQNFMCEMMLCVCAWGQQACRRVNRE